MVYSDLLRNWPGITGNILRAWARVLFMSPDDGCQTVVYCAVADKMREHSGKVFENCAVFKVKPRYRDRETGEKLWNLSLHLCGLDSEIPKEPTPPPEPKPVKAPKPEKKVAPAAPVAAAAPAVPAANNEQPKPTPEIVEPTDPEIKKEQ